MEQCPDAQFSELKQSHSLFYKPFPYFAQDAEDKLAPGASKLATVEDMIGAKRLATAREHALRLVEHGLEGLRYLETYVQKVSCIHLL